MYLCKVCKGMCGYLEGTTRCPKHGLSSFHIEPLDDLSCVACAKKASRCQVCACYVKSTNTMNSKK